MGKGILLLEEGVFGYMNGRKSEDMKERKLIYDTTRENKVNIRI